MITFAQYFCICLLSGPGLLLLINWIRRREPDAGMRHVAGQALLLLAQPFIAAALLVLTAVFAATGRMEAWRSLVEDHARRISE